MHCDGKEDPKSTGEVLLPAKASYKRHEISTDEELRCIQYVGVSIMKRAIARGGRKGKRGRYE